MFTMVRVTQAIALLHVWNTNRQYRPAADWALGSFLGAIGVMLVAFRDLIPVWASVVAANALIIPGWMIVDCGIIRAAGYKVPWRICSLISLSAIVLIFRYSIIEPEYITRVIIFSITALIFDGCAVYASLKSEKVNKKQTFRIIAFSLMVIIASSMWRMVSGVSLGISTILLPAPAQTQFFVCLIIFSIVVTIMLVLLTAQKLQDDINIITQQLIHQREVERDYARISAMTDGLTKIFNRRHFDEALNTEFYRLKRSGAPLSLIMLDVDHFKNFNDRYGHPAGDDCLVHVASAVRSVAGRAHDIVARYGGEEFAVILPDTGRLNAEALAERIRKAVEDLAIPHLASDTAEFVTASLGVVTVLPAEIAAPEKIILLADEALYRAKQRGRNRVEAVDPELLINCSLNEGLSGMVQLAWHVSNECGNAVIDEEHKQLFKISNALLSAVICNHPKDECIVLINTLLEDIIKHFKDEEAILKASGYPSVEEHIRSHKVLAESTENLYKKFKRDELNLGELFSFIAYDVVVQHMLVEDKKFFPYI